MKWQVTGAAGPIQTVEADVCNIVEGGVLVFQNVDAIGAPELVRAFAPGNWQTVTEVT